MREQQEYGDIVTAGRSAKQGGSGEEHMLAGDAVARRERHEVGHQQRHTGQKK